MNTNSTMLFNSYLNLAGFDSARSLTIVQGDKTRLEFELKDKNNRLIELDETLGKAHIIDSDRDVLKAIIDVEVTGSKASFVIDTVLPVDTYELYIKIDEFYFPSTTNSFILNVTEAYDVMDVEESNLVTVDIVVDALREDILDAISQEIESQVEQVIADNPERFRGEKGDPLRFEDLDDEQLDSLRGEAGENLVWDNLSAEQIEMITGKDGKSFDWESLSEEDKLSIKGEKGDTFTWDDLTQDEKDSLRGTQGLSAYQVAVQNGFEGSEYEWLESLEGQDGTDGDDGRSFDYESLTPEQKEEIKGVQGDEGKALTWDDLTQEQIDSLRGHNGEHGKDVYQMYVEDRGFEGTFDDFLELFRGQDGDDGTSVTWEDLTPEQKNSLKGQDGNTVEVAPIVDSEDNEIGYEISVITSDGESTSSGAIYHGRDLNAEELSEEQLRVLSIKIVNEERDELGNTTITFSDGTSITVLRGEQGVQGNPGDEGSPGESAYQVAVNEGFEGVESDWLESLKGAQGDPGEKGDGIKYEDLTPEQKEEMRQGMSVRPPQIYTRAEYDALEEYDEHTLYLVVEEDEIV